MHRGAKASLLSGLASGRVERPTNLTGFINLIFLLFVITNARLLLENALRHGILISLPSPPDADAIADSSSWRNFGETLAVLAIPPLAAFAIERAAVRSPPSSAYRVHGVNTLHAINALLAVAMPCATVYFGRALGGAGGGVLLLIISVTIFLKLTSYAHFHYDLRLAEKESATLDAADLDGRLAKFAANIADTDGGVDVHYPHNVTLPNLGYFLLAPTLCYQTAFPRSPRVRPGYLLSLSLRLLVIATLLPAFTVQYMLPLLEASADAVESRDVAAVIESVLRLSLPVTYTWVTGFYGFFHVWLNLLAELLRFGDRLFYKDWWNATDLEGYWRTWNMPVHHWIVRHAYFPLQRHLTKSRSLTAFFCFTLSAVLHELVVVVPFRSYMMPLAFFGMMAQVPMLPISAWLQRRTRGTAFEQAGNYLFWVTFCFLGQPLCVLMYYMHATRWS